MRRRLQTFQFSLFSFHFNFLSEGVRCGLSQKKPLRDSTHSTALSGLIFCDGPQMTPYHKKFLD